MLLGFSVVVPVFGVPFPENLQSRSNLVEPGGLVGLDRSIRLLRPGDGSYGKSIRGQAIQTFAINDNFSIVNNTFVQGLDRHTKDSAYYSEIIPSAFSFETRTEFHINFDIPFGGGGSGGEPDGGKEAKAPVPQSSPAFVPGNKINFGIDFHYQEVTAFDDYFDEPLNAWNLATSRNFIHYVNFSTFTALPIPNNPGWTGTPGVFNNDTNYSKVFTVALFYEHVFDFGELSHC